MANRYAGPGGSGTSCTQASRCSIATAISQAQPGDVILLQSGTMASPLIYTGSASMIDPPSGKSGASGAPITIRAEVDGGVIIDGQFQRNTISLVGNHWFVIEGMNVRHGLNKLILIRQPTSNIIIRRVVGWDVNATMGESGGCSIANDLVTHILIEDCAMFGPMNGGFGVGDSVDGPVTFRRCYVDNQGYMGGADVSHNAFHPNYSSTKNVTYENCVGRVSYSQQPFSHCFNAGSTYPAGCVDGYRQSGPGARYIFRYRGGEEEGIANRNNRILGCLGYTLATDRWRYNGVQVGPDDAFRAPVARKLNGLHIRDTMMFIHPSNPTFNFARGFQLRHSSGGDDLVFANSTSVRGSRGDLIEGLTDGGDELKWQVTNRFFGSSLSAVPNPWTTTQGANLCYRYVNRVKTTTPLWPWPMNERIRRASIIASGGYSGPCNTCDWSDAPGIQTSPPARAVIDVTAQIESILGTIPSQCLSGPAPPPTPILDVSPTFLSFDVFAGGTSVTKTITVSNVGVGTMTWTVTKDQTWISVSPTSGTNSGVITVTINPSTLSAGQHTGTVTVTAPSASSGSPFVIAITVNAFADFSVSTTTLSFTIYQNSEPQSISVFVASSEIWTVRKSASLSMVTVSPTGRTGSGNFTASASPLAVDIGVYTGTLTVEFETAPFVVIDVTVTVLAFSQIPPPAPPSVPTFPSPNPPVLPGPTPSPSPKFRDASGGYLQKIEEYTTSPRYFVRLYDITRTVSEFGHVEFTETAFDSDFSSGDIFEETKPKIQCLSDVVPGKVYVTPEMSTGGRSEYTIVLSDLDGQITAFLDSTGNQIRPGQRVQLFAGYDNLPESEYISLVKMEIQSVNVSPDLATITLRVEDLQRALLGNVFRLASSTNPVVLEGHPLTLALQILLSTGAGTNGMYDVLGHENGLGMSELDIDIEAFETLIVQTTVELAIILFEQALAEASVTTPIIEEP